jgi:cysteine-rich repeat protein
MGEGARLDDLARDLASGTISRRTALRRLAAGALGIGLAAAPSALAEELERGSCPKNRRCGKKCCAKGAKCKNGKCKCKAGKTKCGKECADLTSDPKHCGTCDNTCDPGRACVGSQCEQCSESEECPQPDFDCQLKVCADGFCGTTQAPAGTECQGTGTCDENGTCILTTCGDGAIQPGEQCDGLNLDGQTCVSQGFAGGTLACDGNCQFDTSACTVSECGNGIVEAGETCDDGNQIDGDGCSSTCQEEVGFDCAGSPSTCVSTCGDGVASSIEACDGPDLKGETCQSRGYASGTLACAPNCQSFDESGCIP